MDYNPYYDNSFQGNRKPNAFLQNGKTLVQEQKEQLLFQEEKRKQDKKKEVEFERSKVQNEELVYLQKQDRMQPNATQRKQILKNLDQQAEQNADGLFFAKVFQQRDAKEQLRQEQIKAYREDLKQEWAKQQQLKKNQKEERKKAEELYQEQLLKEIEVLKERYSKEEEKKPRAISTLKTKHHQHQLHEQSKLLNEFEEHQLNSTNIVPNDLKDQDMLDIRDKQEMEMQRRQEANFRRNEMNTPSHVPQLLSQKTLHDQTVQYPQQAYMQEPSFQQQQYLLQNQNPQYHQHSQMEPPPFYQPLEYRPIVPMLIEKYQREYEELKYVNKMKNREQEEGLDKLRYQLEIQNSIWNEELRRLRAEVQVSQENKNRAFYELDSLKDQLRRQELFEESQLNNTKKELGLSATRTGLQQSRYNGTGSRQYGIPSRTENRIQLESESFEQRVEH